MALSALTMYNIEKTPVFESWLSREQKKKDVRRGITGHSRGCGKASMSVSPQNTAQPLQEANSEAWEPPEILLIDGWID
jgi:hypothetical protein